MAAYLSLSVLIIKGYLKCANGDAAANYCRFTDQRWTKKKQKNNTLTTEGPYLGSDVAPRWFRQ